jgi:uncharacterized protein with HEPN domain
MSRDWELYIEDILEACRKIVLYTEGMSFEQFTTDTKTYDAVVRNLEIIGEASKNIPDAARVMMPEIEWRKTAGLRDIIAHAYFGIDNGILWDIVRRKVPEMLHAVETLHGKIRQE